MSGVRSDRQVGLIALGYVLLALVFQIGPALLPSTFAPYPQLRWGEILDLWAPVAVMPAAWALFLAAGRERPSLAGLLAFVVITAVWVEGQGMHLAANAIGHHVTVTGGDLARLTHDLDERLSHWIWHAAMLAISAAIVIRALRSTAAPWPRPGVLVVVAAVVYGALFFLTVVEGWTWWFALPVGAAVSLGGLVLGRRSLWNAAVGTFVLGYLVAIGLTIAWAAMNDWRVVEFSKAGLIK